MRIPITKPFFGSEELQALRIPLETGWVAQGPFVGQFEEKFSAFTGVRFSVATSSGTAALHLAVATLGLRPADEVIVPAFTWVSTANAVEYMGATPIFCDIDLNTFNLNPDHIDALITPRTVGIIPVHLFGLCADMGPILEIARKHALWVVEDAACAFGSRYQGAHAGTFGDMGCFSFHPRKSITTGEGGMLTTQSEDYDRLARTLRSHGASQPEAGQAAPLLGDHHYLGYNYRMTDLQGALGCAQMERATWLLAQRARCVALYDRLLADVEWLTTPSAPEGYLHGFQAYVCLFRPEELALENLDRLHRQRNELMARLEAKGISTRQGTHAPVTLAYYASKYGLQPEQFPSAFVADRLSLALPLYPQMTEGEQREVVRELLAG